MAIALTLTHSLFSPPLSISKPHKLSSRTSNPNLSVRTTTRRTTTSGWRISVANGDAVEKVQEIVPTVAPSDDISFTVISSLLFLAFVALSVLTIGVVYLGVTDFLQKREKEKFEKAEEERKKNEGKKKKKKRDRSGYMIGPKGPIKLRRNPYDDD